LFLPPIPGITGHNFTEIDAEILTRTLRDPPNMGSLKHMLWNGFGLSGPALHWLSWREIIDTLEGLSHQEAAASGKESTDHNESEMSGEERLQIPADAYEILGMICDSPTRLKVQDIAAAKIAGVTLDRKTVGKHLKTLAADGLVDYDPRQKTGAAATVKGREFLESTT
jgi:DNA-binding transcriptional ArsR family regulator